MGHHLYVKGETFTLQGNFMDLDKCRGGAVFEKIQYAIICYQQMPSEGVTDGWMDKWTVLALPCPSFQ